MFRFLLVLGLVWSAAGGAQGVQHVFEGLARTRVPYVAARSNALETAPNGRYLIDGSGRTDSVYLDSLRQSLINLLPIVEARYELGSLPTEPGTGGSAPTTVTWYITEGRTVFPIVSLGGIRGNAFYQIGINDLHLRGRGGQLTVSYQNNDGEHNYQVFLRNPTLRGGRWGYYLESRRYAAVEPLYFPTAVDYRYANQTTGAGVSYATRTRQIFSFGASTLSERYRKVATPTEEATPGPNDVALRKYLFKLDYDRNRLDYHAERRSGASHKFSVQSVGTRGANEVFLIALHDFRYFQLRGTRVNFAARVRSGLSTNNDSPFAPFVLDSQVNIRGSGNRIDRGTAQLVLNVEYRYTAWRDRSGRFAAQAIAFSDLGTWRNPGGRLGELWARASIRHFIGGGIRLISPKAHNAVLRLDYGVDIRNTDESGLVAGVGQFF